MDVGTIELRRIIESNNLILFDFDYEFYDNTLKNEFEKMFGDYFYFRNIGHETIGRFKFELRSKLNIIAPYYKQLYKTEVESRNIQFLLNKDLKETYIKTLKGENIIESMTEDTSLINSNGENINIFSDMPKSRIENLDNYMTNATKDILKNDNKATNNSKGKNDNIVNQEEKTELISQGNIGTTSSAQLLESWRSCLININQLIFNELEELFYGLY